MLLSGGDVEALYGLSEKTLRSMRARGLRSTRPTGHGIFYRREWIDDYLEQTATGGEYRSPRRLAFAKPRPRGRTTSGGVSSLLKPGQNARPARSAS